MVATCDSDVEISIQCAQPPAGMCSNEPRPCGCQIQCGPANANEEPDCTWNCNQADPICGGQPCLAPSSLPNCCYDNPSYCTTAKNCNPTVERVPDWFYIVALVLFFIVFFR